MTLGPWEGEEVQGSSYPLLGEDPGVVVNRRGGPNGPAPLHPRHCTRSQAGP